MKKIFDALVDGSVALISRFLPDAYILVLLLTVILFVVAVPVTGIAPAEGITVADRLVNLVYDGWYGGFWNLLGFGMQMVLIVVTVRNSQIREKVDSYNVRLEQLNTQIEKEQARTQEIEEYGKYTQTKKFVEEVAKEKLGLVYENEIIYKQE